MKLFLPQRTLEEWTVGDKADLQEGQLLLKEGKALFPVAAAVHFSKVITGEDKDGLLGRVKTSSQLQAIGAEHLADSVILGDTAYEVVEGYVTEVQPPPAQKGGDPKKKGSSPEADLLAAFILDKL